MGALLSSICPCLRGEQAETDPPGNPIVAFATEAHSKGAIVSNFCLSGEGMALANTPCLQTRAYWEVTVVELPDGADFRVGVAQKTAYIQPEDLLLGSNNKSWGLGGPERFQEGDVIGVTLDLAERPRLNFYKNGDKMTEDDEKFFTKGEVYPACSVTKGALLEANFGHKNFVHAPPNKFEGVIYVKSII